MTIVHTPVRIREVVPGDEAHLEAMFSHSTPEDIRLRCLGMIKNFPHLAAAHLAAMDGAHEVALVALEDGNAGEYEAVGVVHIVDQPASPGSAEFDVMVRTDRKGHGVGFQLMGEVLARARARKLRRIDGFVLFENRAMLKMTRELGFKAEQPDTGVVRVSLVL